MSTSKCSNPGCEKAGKKRCSQCQSVFYCDEPCQRSNWKEHRPKCKAIKKQMDEKKKKSPEEELAEAKATLSSSYSAQVSSASGWAVGLSPPKQREWLVDCYRMRLDDEYVWQGDIRAGSLYDPDHSPEEVVLDFLVFCRLAVAHGALPEDWNWSAFLAVAEGLIPYAFEKSDAQEKYGSENVFSAAMGGRSLRYTGEIIYGSSGMQGRESELHQKIQGEVLYKRRTNSMVANVGGMKAWDRLEAKLMQKL